MEIQDAPATFLFKLWPKIEANWIRIAWGGGIAVVAVLVISFYSWQQGQNEITAGKALTQLMVTTAHNVLSPGQQADLFLKVATDYPGTAAGQRAWLQGAAILFTMGNYPEAQVQFQKFLDKHPDSLFAGQAALGVGTSLDAQGKADMAAAIYQQIIKKYADVIAVTSARFALAQIDERQGRLADAAGLYEDIAQNNPNGSIGSEAGLRAMELKMKPQSPAPAAAPAVPFKLN